VKKKLYIVGTGGHARKVTETAILSGWQIAGYLEEKLEKHTNFMNNKVTSDFSVVKQTGSFFIVAIGEGAVRMRIQQKLENLGGRPVSLRHPEAYISRDAIIGEGTVILAKAVIESMVKIGKGVIIDIGALIDHDTEIENYIHVRPGTILVARSKLRS